MKNRPNPLDDIVAGKAAAGSSARLEQNVSAPRLQRAFGYCRIVATSSIAVKHSRSQVRQ
jgi:hypothetical protein